jgi:hypothetical protein
MIAKCSADQPLRSSWRPFLSGIPTPQRVEFRRSARCFPSDKVWTQFQRAGQVTTASFTVKVGA